MATKEDFAKKSLQHLQDIVQRLDPVLNPYGFVFELHGSGFSSLAAFASGYYNRLPVEIGLIYRHSLGSVGYHLGEFNTGISHTDYMDHLGHADDCKLIYDEGGFESIARDGTDPVTALIYDLEHFAKPMLEGDIDEFTHIVKTLNEMWSKRV